MTVPHLENIIGCVCSAGPLHGMCSPVHTRTSRDAPLYVCASACARVHTLIHIYYACMYVPSTSRSTRRYTTGSTLPSTTLEEQAHQSRLSMCMCRGVCVYGVCPSMCVNLHKFVINILCSLYCIKWLRVPMSV